jgi:enterochelin esterase family protein
MVSPGDPVFSVRTPTRLIRRPVYYALAFAMLGSVAAMAPASGQDQASDRIGPPEVHTDGRVTFRRRAPDANDVRLVLEGSGPTSMLRNEDGVWSLTTDPLSPDFYTYHFLVDGTPAGDPANPLGKPVITGGQEGLVHVPGPDTLVWEQGDAPPGALRRHVYESHVIGEERELWVYTPPGYEQGATPGYPVLYLLHGVMDDARAWTTAGRAHVILDNLIARGQAEPMLVVMPLGYGFADAPERAPTLLGPIDHRPLMDAFAESLLREVIPLVEESYAVRADPDSRAIAGLSMGGSQALYVGMNHPDRFGWVVSMSGALIMYGGRFDELFPGAGDGSLERVRLISMTTGAEDFVLGVNRQFSEWLAARGVSVAYQETPGGHTWGVWRRALTSLAPLLFKPAR